MAHSELLERNKQKVHLSLVRGVYKRSISSEKISTLNCVLCVRALGRQGTLSRASLQKFNNSKTHFTATETVKVTMPVLLTENEVIIVIPLRAQDRKKM